MTKLHVIIHKDELDPARAAGKIAVVFDVLFATSTIVTALAHGASAVIPTLDEAVARQVAADQSRDNYLLAGEKNAEQLEGFAPFAPLALSRCKLRGRRVIYSTTNGTVALRRAVCAHQVYAAALINATATATHLLRHHHGRDLLLVCAGSSGRFNLEDFLGAGALVAALSSLGDTRQPTDAAMAAGDLYRRAEVVESLATSRVGRMVSAMGLKEELRYCATTDSSDTVCLLEDDAIVVAGD